MARTKSHQPRRRPSVTDPPEPSRPGRPPKLTRDVARIIVSTTMAGEPLRVAAAAAGVSPSSLASWLRLGRQGHPTYRGLHHLVTLAHTSWMRRQYRKLMARRRPPAPPNPLISRIVEESRAALEAYRGRTHGCSGQ